MIQNRLSQLSNSPTPQSSGFTLIELIVVLTFMVVAAALVIPRFGSFQRAGQARDTARSLMALVREAREIAVEQQRSLMLSVNPQTRAIEIEYDDTLSPPTTGGTGVIAVGGNAVERPRPPIFYPEPLTVQMESTGTALNPSTTLMTFTPDGRVPDTDFVVQYAPNQAYLVTVRRQGTRVRLDSPDSPEALSTQGAMH